MTLFKPHARSTFRNGMALVLLPLLLFIFGAAGAETEQSTSLTFQVVADPATGDNFDFTVTGASIDAEKASFRYRYQWGSVGTEPGQFQTIGDIDIDSQGNLYLTDSQLKRIQKFSPNGTFISEWGEAGTGEGQFESPFLLAIDRQDNVYVADQQRILKFLSDGSYLMTIDSSQTGNFDGLGADSAGNLYLSSFNENKVHKYGPDGSFLLSWEMIHEHCCMEYTAMGIDVGPDDRVYVANSDNNRIEIFEPNGTKSGEILGSPTVSLGFMTGIQVMSNGNVAVVDSGQNIITVISPTGELISQLGGFGPGERLFNTLWGIAANQDGTLYIPDRGDMRIQAFQRLGILDFTLDQATPDDGDSVPNSITFDNLDPGVVTLTESLPLGWQIRLVDCTFGTTTNQIGPEGIEIDVERGDQTTCFISIVRTTLYFPWMQTYSP